MENYVDIAYDPKEKPLTSYPEQLVDYLCTRFNLVNDMTILDNGCGRGEFLEAFERQGLKASGTDADIVSEKIHRVDLNIERLPFDDESFDVVFSKSVIEHLEKTEMYMSEMGRVLKKGGLLILMAPDWETQYKIFYQDPTHVHPYTVKSIERLLRMKNYQNIIVEKFTQLPAVWKNPFACAVSKALSMVIGPVKKIYKNKFIRFSCELMVLGVGYKQA